jgi:RHS repeat-associated protein
VWTTYTYDSSGRTLTVTSPDGASVTRYTYQGNQTTVTDPAGKSKTFTSDAMGNLVTVSEPDPVSGTDTTTYTYNAANQLLTVTMPRSNGTQTRSFQWTGSDMTSATNPENGTVTYTYDGAHRVKTRIDAKGQKTQYLYDQYGRKTMVQHYNSSGVEQTSQRVTYTYGDNPGAPTDFSQNSWGRLVAVTFSNETPGSPEQFTYLYGYTTAGRVARQRMQLGTGTTFVNLDATYEWDNEGKMTSMVPPGGGIGGGTPNKYLNFYDPFARLNGMTETSCLTQTVTQMAPVYPCTSMGSSVATAAYGPAGETTALTYDGFSESRTYNSLLQLTRMTATGSGQTVMDMQYTFSGTQNNGRITQSTDGVSAETVVYTYDTLNRLTKAETTSAAWGDAHTYDGFGNLTAKTPTKGTAPSMTAAYDAPTNHQVGQTNDANGNPGFNGTYPYDVENHLLQPLTSGTSPQWTYDPSGKRVFAKTPGNGTTMATTCELYFYGITGQKLTTFQCGYNDQTGGIGQFWYQVKSRNVYFGGKLMRSAGVTVVTDRLGSVRANSNGERMSYFPYGEERTATADGREKFGTYFRDPAANGGLDYADQRYYSNASGRFLTADPSAGSGAGDPGSWNRYAYVGGDPVNFKDPSGLIRSGSDGGDDSPSYCDDNPTALGCLPPGGQRRPGAGRPRPTPFTTAEGNLSAAVDALSNRGNVSPDCQNDLDALSQAAGRTIDLAGIQDALNDTTFQNGLTSALPVSALYGPGAEQAGAAFQAQEDSLYGPGQTIGDEFRRNPGGLTAETVLLGDTIFINPGLIGRSVPVNEALLFHEALHELGLTDDAVQRALGITVDAKNTKNITDKLKKDCIAGRGNN